ncbi:MAG: carboxylesterase family protein, partial [Fuerstiella sp.]|nr:carboxylesterase family protein [Fuerstiella sp.]
MWNLSGPSRWRFRFLFCSKSDANGLNCCRIRRTGSSRENPSDTCLPDIGHSGAKRDIPYAVPAHKRNVLDVYSPDGAQNLPVIFWIHGGGWQQGDKSDVQIKPRVFCDRGYVFVSTNYRLLPHVEMRELIRDVAKSLGWVHRNIADSGGDP